MRNFLSLLRVRQWIKNLLVFTAPFFAGLLNDSDVFKKEILIFLVFCFASSLGYIINDWQDRKIDQLHPIKKNRAFASGAINAGSGVIIAVILIIGQVMLEINMPLKLNLVLNGYLLITLSYSLFLKKIPVVELIVLTFGFLLRPLGGAVALEIPVSKWFLIVVGFGSLFVGATKRYAEFTKSSEREVRAVLSQYTDGFLQSVINVSMTISLMAYTLWVFQNPRGEIWSELSLIPVTLGILRYTWHRERGDAETPEELIFKDPILLFCGLVTVLLLAVSIYLK